MLTTRDNRRRFGRAPLGRVFVVSLGVCIVAAAEATAQSPVDGAGSSGAPRLESARVFGPQVSPAQTAPQTAVPTCTVQGVVTDDDGAAVPGAQVTLEMTGSGRKLVTTAGPDGRYRFSSILPGPFRVTATASGFAPEGAPGNVQAGETAEVPPIELPVAMMSDQIDVTLTKHDIAEEEIKQEETQRVLGFLPNYYVTYNWHAVPLSPGQKFRLAARTLYDPFTLAITGVTAGAEQAAEVFPQYHEGAAGYFRRYGANYADQAIGTMIGGAALPVLFHQDPRYFYKGTGTFRARLLYALAAAVICRGDNGKWQPNYSSVLGDLAAGALSNTYYPSEQRTGAKLTIENGLLDVGEDALGNLVQEFVFKHVTPHAPTYPQATTAKPASNDNGDKGTATASAPPAAR